MEGNGVETAIQILLGLVIDRLADGNSTLTRWQSTGEKISNTFGRQALPMVWDFCEANPFCDATRSLDSMIDWVIEVIEHEKNNQIIGQVDKYSATDLPLPRDSVQAFVTDPPYYDSVPYAHLSDFFYVWLKRTIGKESFDLFSSDEVPKAQEIVVDRPHSLSNSTHNIFYYEKELMRAFVRGREVLTPNGIGTIVFASKTTSSWEAIINAVIRAGWVITGSWPIDTEMPTKVAGIDQARLMSSIHLICRPREDALSGELITSVGDWRYVLSELPNRIHSWLPRLAHEEIVGADAIFACLGPALEIFSRYSRVEKASGEVVTLKEYLEVVWAAVSREAMSVIFEGADATGFEEDARLTAMWLWTLSGNKPENQPDETENADTEETDEETPSKANGSGSHYALEYDTARKIAQGLGAHLDRLNSLVEVKGDKARLLLVSERAGSLFGREENPLQDARKKTASLQPSLFSLMVTADGSSAEDEWQEDRIPTGQTTLDQIHQAMLLFGAGRSAALKRFLVDDGIGKAERFWRLAQALSALYPSNSEEKRWVDGVLAKKKGLGF